MKNSLFPFRRKALQWIRTGGRVQDYSRPFPCVIKAAQSKTQLIHNIYEKKGSAYIPHCRMPFAKESPLVHHSLDCHEQSPSKATTMSKHRICQDCPIETDWYGTTMRISDRLLLVGSIPLYIRLVHLSVVVYDGLYGSISEKKKTICWSTNGSVSDRLW